MQMQVIVQVSKYKFRSLRDFCKKEGVPYATIYSRLRRATSGLKLDSAVVLEKTLDRPLLDAQRGFSDEYAMELRRRFTYRHTNRQKSAKH